VRPLRAWALAFAVCVGASASAAWAQAIAFTVQAIAVSEQETALELSRALLRDGYPAYVVRSTGGQGDVYRVRVGAFANRAAAARYAASMPDVGGARPVPALAEVIPEGVMEQAPRVLWQGPATDVDVHLAPWPGGGVALRVQSVGPPRQPTYVLVQDGEVRTIAAWRAVPLAVRPEPSGAGVLDVPFVDLTTEPAEGEEPAPEAPAPEPTSEPTSEPAGAAGDGDAPPAVPPGAAGDPEEGPPPAEDGTEEGAAEGAAPDAAPDAADPSPPVQAEPEAPQLAAPDGPPEVALWLLRDRPLWPTTWPDDGEDVRAAFASATLQLVAVGTGVDVATVEASAYLPGGEPPPTVVVADVADRTGRDAGDVRALGDAAGGLFASGPEPVDGADPTWWPPADLGERVRTDGPAAGPFAWSGAALEVDGPFVRWRPDGGGPGWRAVAGTPLWSDGRYLLLRDGDELVLVDFVAR
jgi:hypothetical protein